jgi:hypothetical protein
MQVFDYSSQQDVEIDLSVFPAVQLEKQAMAVFTEDDLVYV